VYLNLGTLEADFYCTAFVGLRVTSSVTLALWVTLAVVERIWQFPSLVIALMRDGTDVENTRNRVRLCLMGNTIANIIMSTFCAALAYDVPFSGSAENCDWLGRTLGVWYAFAVQCCYLFLCERANVVRRLMNDVWWYTWLARLMYFGTLFGVPLVLIVLVLVFDRGVILPGGGCMHKESVLWIAVGFAVCDFLLTVGLLVLFIVPLRSHASVMNNVNPRSAAALRQVARRSTFAATLALAVTLGAILFSSYTFGVVADSDPRKDALLITAIAVLMCDLTVNGLVCKMLTIAWLPDFVVRWLETDHLSDPEGRQSFYMVATSRIIAATDRISSRRLPRPPVLQTSDDNARQLGGGDPKDAGSSETSNETTTPLRTARNLDESSALVQT